MKRLGLISFFSLLLASNTMGQEVVLNKTQSNDPVTPNYAIDILLNPNLGADLSSEAKKIIGRPFVPMPEGYTSKDTLFSPALFMPLIFDAGKIERLHLPAEKIRQGYSVMALNSFRGKNAVEEFLNDKFLAHCAASNFAGMMQQWNFARNERARIYLERPEIVKLTYANLPNDRIEFHHIEGKGYQGELAVTEINTAPVSTDALSGETVNRKYWVQHFNASVHFAQNQISDNWHKGGINSLNMNSRVLYNLTYEKDKVKWVNQLEYKMGLFSNQEDSEKRDIKISEDVFRINTNLGLRAFENWYYTFDAQLRTQMFQSVNKEDVVTARIFAPLMADAGIGMKYDINKKKFRGDPFQNFSFSANVAPISATLIYTYTDDIDKGRIGLKQDEKHRLRLGSTVRLNLKWDMSSALSWTSRLFYNTSYKHIETEFENRISYAFSNHFSAAFNIIFRYDDSVITDQPKTFKNLLQYNELFSFGFEYKF